MTFKEPPGNYEICPICYWEDDIVQLKDPDFEGGANDVSLREAQKNYQKFEAIEERFAEKTRKPNPSEHKDKKWFPLEEDTKINENKLYYWEKL